MACSPTVRFHGWLLAALLTGCSWLPDKEAVLDPDGDGAVYGEDCNDERADVFPGANEVYYDGLDNDCDSATSDGDADGDGLDAVAVGGEDCDDEDPGAYPSAVDIVDGHDQNCDGVDGTDQDGDGFASEASGGEDCDDGRVDVFPSAVEVCDGVDNDCDGVEEDEDAVDAIDWYLDADGDGYGDVLGGATACSRPDGYANNSDDCDDDDAAINPDITELCDGVDNDCDGVEEDEDAVDAIDWYLDADGDGYGDRRTSMSACEPPYGYANNGDDCDDMEPDINPEAIETCDTEDADEDCDGLSDDEDSSVDTNGFSTWYRDADGDGYGSARDVSTCDLPSGYAENADDCNDADDTTWPGAAEICGDGVVNDCESDEDTALSTCGVVGTFDLSAADAKLVGEAAGDVAGISVSGAGDVDGDGTADLLLGAYGTVTGAAYLVLGPVTGTLGLSEADTKLVGEASEDLAGKSVSRAGDVDGDGGADIVVGAHYESSGGVDAGAAYLVLGPVTGTLDLSEADAKLIGESTNHYAGYSVSGGGNVDGEGAADVLVGAYGEDSGGVEAGAAYLVLGPVTGTLDLSEADAKLIGENAGDEVGFTVSGEGDTDGDGAADLLIGASGQDTGGTNAGAAYLVLGPVTGTLDLSEAGAKLIGENAGDYAGWSVSDAGDVDGEGSADLLVGARYEDTGGTHAGAAYLVLGPVTGTLDLSEADARLIGENAGDYAGWSVTNAGDVDGEGTADLLVGASDEDSGGDDAGAAYLVYGAVTGTLDLSEADAKLVGEAEGDRLGRAVAAAGDVDADGAADLFLGAPYETTGGTNAGAAYLVLGGAW